MKKVFDKLLKSVIFRFKPVTTHNVYEQLRSLKRNKSPGIDNIPSRLLKDSADVLTEPLAYVINLSLKTGIMPNDWTFAKIVPIHKSGSKGKFDNYRPISILPVISKIIEKVVHSQLLSFLEESKLLYKNQFGFRPKMSTEHASRTVFADDIRSKVDKEQLVGAIFIDLTKAFDTISNSKLLSKLEKYGVHDTEYAWFQDYLFNCRASVEYGNSTSTEMSIFSGVPQGSVIGPLLFFIIFNDMVDVILHSKVVKYADDTVLYLGGKHIFTINKSLQRTWIV